MPKLPFMKFFPADFLVDIQTLNLRETGAWIKLMCYIWLHSDDGTVELSNAEVRVLLQDEHANAFIYEGSDCGFTAGKDYAMSLFCSLWDKGVFDNERRKVDEETYNKITSRRIAKDKKALNSNKIRQKTYNARITRNKRGYNTKITPKKSEVRSQNKDICASFDAFWNSYPKKVSKVTAKKAWDKIKPDEALTDVIVKSVEAFAQTEGWRKDGGQFVPYPATFLNQKRWEDQAPALPRMEVIL